jgi:hypothetical protein
VNNRKVKKCIVRDCNTLGYIRVWFKYETISDPKRLPMCKKHAAAYGNPILW